MKIMRQKELEYRLSQMHRCLLNIVSNEPKLIKNTKMPPKSAKMKNNIYSLQLNSLTDSCPLTFKCLCITSKTQ